MFSARDGQSNATASVFDETAHTCSQGNIASQSPISSLFNDTQAVRYSMDASEELQKGRDQIKQLLFERARPTVGRATS